MDDRVRGRDKYRDRAKLLGTVPRCRKSQERIALWKRKGTVPSYSLLGTLAHESEHT